MPASNGLKHKKARGQAAANLIDSLKYNLTCSIIMVNIKREVHALMERLEFINIHDDGVAAKMKRKEEHGDRYLGICYCEILIDTRRKLILC
jgi:hypothetical protein